MVVKKMCQQFQAKVCAQATFFSTETSKKKNIERSVCKEKHNGYFSVLLGA